MDEKQTIKVQSRTSTVCLLLGFVVVTTALVVLTVLGSIYIKNLQNKNEEQQIEKEKSLHLQMKENTNLREVLENREEQIKLMKNKGVNGQTNALIAIQYSTGLMSIYVPEKRACFFIGGIMKEAGSFDDDPYINISLGQLMPHVKSGAVLLKYSVNEGNPITNIKLFPKVVSPYCTGSNSYWIHRNETLNLQDGNTTPATSMTSPPSREKRWLIGIHFHVHINFNFNFGK